MMAISYTYYGRIRFYINRRVYDKSEHGLEHSDIIAFRNSAQILMYTYIVIVLQFEKLPT